jgi:hypothetical protein
VRGIRECECDTARSHVLAELWGAQMTKIGTLSDAELRQRREAILQKLGVSLNDLRARATNYALLGEEHDAWEQLESIAFLLGETSA